MIHQRVCHSPHFPFMICHVTVLLNTKKLASDSAHQFFNYLYPFPIQSIFPSVPWQPATNNTRVQLYDHSLNVLPLLSFNNKTLQDLDDLYSQLGGEVTIQFRDIHHNIAKLQPVTTTTLNDALKYLALSLTFLPSLIFIALF